MSVSTTLRAQRLKKIILDWNFQSRLKISISIENFNPGPSEFPTKIGVWWVARLKISISIENFNPGGRSWIFSIFGPLGDEEDKRATTNVQNRFVQFFLLPFLIFCSPWAKTPCFEGESPGGKIMKKCEKVRKIMKKYETILPFSCCPLVFPWVSTMRGRYWNSVSAFPLILCSGESLEAEFTRWFWRHWGSRYWISVSGSYRR